MPRLLTLRDLRLPIQRMVLILALCGGAAGLLRLKVPGPEPTPPVPSGRQLTSDTMLLADADYRLALFAQQSAARLGVLGTTSPTSWEEAAVARYERLALGGPPVALACQRLGVIYGRRGYLPQARAMLAKAGSLDLSLSGVCASLALVYSKEPIRSGDVPRMRELLEQQPRWLVLLTLADLGHRLGKPEEERSFRTAGDRELRRFGFGVLYLFLVQGALGLGAIVAALVLGVRALFRREQLSLPWYSNLAFLRWPEVVDVVAVMAFCTALGHVARRALTSGLMADAPPALAARVAHYLLVAIPALALVITRTRSRDANWRRALGLRWPGGGAVVWPAALALGLTLLAAPWAVDALGPGLGVLLSRLGAAGVGGGSSSAGLGVDLMIALALAPVVEEVIFRGFVFRALLERLHPLLAAGASGLLFAAVHVPWDPQTLISLFVLGTVTAYTYRATRSLWPCIIAHAGYNACVLVTGLVLRM